MSPWLQSIVLTEFVGCDRTLDLYSPRRLIKFRRGDRRLQAAVLTETRRKAPAFSRGECQRVVIII